uniref:Alpha/beta-gliadin A-V-like n=1 Tax=Saccoglossus kowalevskii TaxID=10224 RepID=A0ABM0M5C4_SACKO|nr:PREDICTED: alpha/beta-gliadin A-V-like [Saccoglossus kowalevskii]
MSAYMVTSNQPVVQPQLIAANQPVIQPQLIAANQPVVQPQLIAANQPVIQPQLIAANQPVIQPQLIAANQPVVQPQLIAANQPVVQSQLIAANQPNDQPQLIAANQPVIQPQLIAANQQSSNQQQHIYAQYNHPAVQPTLLDNKHTLQGKSATLLHRHYWKFLQTSLGCTYKCRKSIHQRSMLAPFAPFLRCSLEAMVLQYLNLMCGGAWLWPPHEANLTLGTKAPMYLLKGRHPTQECHKEIKQKQVAPTTEWRQIQKQ